MLNCRQVTELASDHLDSQTGFWRRQQIRLHMLVCRHCRRFKRHLKRSSATAGAVASRLWRTDSAEVDAVLKRLRDKPDSDQRDEQEP